MAKKILSTLLVVLMCAALLCACGGDSGNTTTGKTNETTNAPEETTAAPEETTAAPEVNNGTTEIVLSDYLSQDVWEDDGGDAYIESDNIHFDNCFSGDFAAVRLTEEAQNVTYRFNVQIKETGAVSMDDWTWWDCELLIIARSSIAAASWYDDGSQTGYTLTSWGDLSEVYIGRSGYDDAFGCFEWNINDGEAHAVELSVVNNEDNTAVTITLVVDGVEIASVVDDGSLVKNERPALYPDAGGLTIRCKYLEAVIS